MNTPAIVDMPDGRRFHVEINDDGRLTKATYTDGIAVDQHTATEIEHFIAELYTENEVYQ